MVDRFAGRVALVAGGTGGLGRSVALAFLSESARVNVTYRVDDEFMALKSSAGQHATLLRGYNVDVTNEAETAGLVESIVGEGGSLNYMINTVGGYAGGSPLWETAPDVFDRMMSLNVRSGFVLARAAVPAMLKQGGSIVNVSSRAALDHAAGAAAYVASKAAALAMMDSLAADLAGKGVRVNTVLPSIIDTEANRRAMPGADFTKWPRPEDIARVILFLCSDESSLIHGAAVPVYGAG